MTKTKPLIRNQNGQGHQIGWRKTWSRRNYRTSIRRVQQLLKPSERRKHSEKVWIIALTVDRRFLISVRGAFSESVLSWRCGANSSGGRKIYSYEFRLQYNIVCLFVCFFFQTNKNCNSLKRSEWENYNARSFSINPNLCACLLHIRSVFFAFNALFYS